MKEKIKFVQEQLNKKGINSGTPDGIIGNKTLGALAKIDELDDSWSSERKVIGFIQLLCKEKDIETGKLDGYWGPQTAYAYEQLKELLEKGELPKPWREDRVNPLVLHSNTNDWPDQNYDELVKYYGNVGENQTRIELPYPHILSWDLSQKISSFSCHEKVHDSLKRVLNKVLSHYGEQKIKELRLDIWGGCLSVRKMRGGTEYSTHSWGIAIDYDPQNNQLKWTKEKASFAKPEYEAWWKIWESEGWISLGRAKDYDWMHVQAARV